MQLISVVYNDKSITIITLKLQFTDKPFQHKLLLAHIDC